MITWEHALCKQLTANNDNVDEGDRSYDDK